MHNENLNLDCAHRPSIIGYLFRNHATMLDVFSSIVTVLVCMAILGETYYYCCYTVEEIETPTTQLFRIIQLIEDEAWCITKLTPKYSIL